MSAKANSFAEADEKVKEQFSSYRPMQFHEITKKARERGGSIPRSRPRKRP